MTEKMIAGWGDGKTSIPYGTRMRIVEWKSKVDECSGSKTQTFETNRIEYAKQCKVNIESLKF